MERKTALYIGSCTVDVNATCPSLHTVCTTHHQHTEKYAYLSFASKTLLDDVSLDTGGSAANSAYTTELLGSNVDLVSAVGKDVFGKLVLEDLKARGISTRHVRIFPKEKTSVGINVLCGAGEKTNLVHKGATDALGKSDLAESWVNAADAVVCTSLASEKNFSLFKKAILLSKKHGKFLVFAPSITMLRKRRKELDGMKQEFDVAVMNAEEACFFTHSHDPMKALDKMPGKLKVMTWDQNGSYVEEFGRVWHVPTLKVKVRDTTGAGDAFTGALVHELLHHGDALQAVQLATATACFNLQKVGAKVEGTAKEIHAYQKKKRFQA